MHSYSIDRDLRSKVIIYIFILSMLISLILNNFFSGVITNIVYLLHKSKIKNTIEFLEWLEITPNFLGIPFWYAIVSIAYDKWFWKLKFIRHWHGIPNLNGKWSGTLSSAFNDKSIPMEMEIEQTWSKISFKSIFPKTDSSSCSNVAAIYVDGYNGTEIYFGFKNESYNVKEKMQSYNGYNVLKLIEQNKIKARYFNERENPNPDIKGGNKGTFEITRLSNA